MKKSLILTIALAVLPILRMNAQEEKVKTGLNFGPLPAVSFDADKGLQYGGILSIYNFGDGSSYPNYKSKWYFESSWYTKGSKLFQVMYDNRELFPGVRFCASGRFDLDSSFDFYGLNGYGTLFDASANTYLDSFSEGSIYNSLTDAAFRPFYRMKRNMYLLRADFIGEISEALHWKAGYHFSKFDMGTIDYDNINKGKEEADMFPKTIPTLLDCYTNWGIIPEDQKNGGIYSCIRVGLEYDTRDKEGAPSRGIWADAHIGYSPKWLGASATSTRYSLIWRQYFPIIDNNVLTFAYRLNYTGTIGNSCPFYILPFLTVVGVEVDGDGMGGYKTCRGVMRDRVMGLDTGLYNAELRWRFTQFHLLNQNIALGLNAFSDGTMVFRSYDTSYKPINGEGVKTQALYNAMIKGTEDAPHITVGAGFRFIMNENFIVALDYGTPLTHLNVNSKHYNEDGTGAMYINLGYLF